MNILQDSSIPNTPEGTRNPPDSLQGLENQVPGGEEDLIVGATLPSISSHSNLNYHLTGLQSTKVIYTCAAVPLVLHNLDDVLWKNGTFPSKIQSTRFWLQTTAVVAQY